MHVLGVYLIGLLRRSYKGHISDGPTLEGKPQATMARNSLPLTPDSRRSIQTANTVRDRTRPDPNMPRCTQFRWPRNSHRSRSCANPVNVAGQMLPFSDTDN